MGIYQTDHDPSGIGNGIVRILLIDQDRSFCDSFLGMLGDETFHCSACGSMREARAMRGDEAYDLIFVGSELPEGSGVEQISSLQQFPGEPTVVLVTSGDSLESAEAAIMKGAWDYLTKPCSVRNVKLTIRRAMRFRDNKRNGNGKSSFKRPGIVGSSAKLQMCLDAASKAANCQISTLIYGETGTGKELFARAIHDNSQRHDGPFVVMDCTNIPETLTESILFGHTKGAFTGATDDRTGLFKLACGGTLFLDEVGELELQQQRSLLRVLQEQRFRPVGSAKELKSNFRLIAATNRDLKAMVEDGDFRQDLYYRLTGILIGIPPLRERRADIATLLDHYLGRVCSEKNASAKQMSDEYRRTMLEYDWPGNIRELINAVYYSFEMAMHDELLLVQHLPVDIRVGSLKKVAAGLEGEGACLTRCSGAALASRFAANKDLPSFKTARRLVVDELEKEYFRHLVEISEGSHQKACEISGLSKARLYELLKKQGIALRG
ncbi:MAG: sigma-54-dependent transcriptional regulator [Desulfovibrionaceae bacterium]